MLNSRLGLFTAALSGLHPNRAPLLPKLRGHFAESLTRVLSITLGFSPRLPVSVCGTGTSHLARGFSWQCGIRNFATTFRSPSQLSLMGNGFAYSQPNCLDADIQYRAYPILLRPPIAQMVRRWYRNINLLSIAYAFRPRLRSRLTLSGRAFLRKP